MATENLLKSPRLLNIGDIQVGLTASFDHLVDEEMATSFSKLSGDYNPLHNDRSFASKLGYKDRVAHGAIQQALISRFAGMYIPGVFSVIKRLSTAYSKPIIVGDLVRVTGKVVEWVPEELSGKLEISVKDIHGSDYSFTRLDFGLTSENKQAKHVQINSEHRIRNVSKNAVVFLGGNSALAREVIATNILATDDIVTVGRRGCDLILTKIEDADSFLSVLNESNPRHLVSFLSLSPVKNSVSNFNVEHLIENIGLHFEPLLKVAKFLNEGLLTELKTITIIGSSGAAHLSPERGYESYGYCKMLIAKLVKDLARDLAAKNVRVNIISPGELMLGMTSGLSPKTVALLQARTPSGKLTTAEDVANALEFLISDAGSGHYGQEIVLAGGRL